MKRIAIIGAGAIGSALGALLRRAGCDVALIGRPDHVSVIRKSGLRVDGVCGSFTVAIRADEALVEAPDIVFLTMKTQDVLATVDANRTILGRLPLVTFQNGVRSDEIVASALPEADIVSVVVNFHARFTEPGKITILYGGSLLVGRPFSPNDDLVAGLAATLSAAFPTRVTDNIGGAHWLKLIVNLNNAFPALTNLTLREVYRDRGLRGLSVRTMREGLAVAKRAGIVLEGLPDMPSMFARAVALLPLPLAGRLAAVKVASMETRWPLIGSTLQSLLRHEPTEIDYLNGEIVRVGGTFGMATPVNSAIVRLIHDIERTGRFLTPKEVCAAIADGSIS